MEAWTVGQPGWQVHVSRSVRRDFQRSPCWSGGSRPPLLAGRASHNEPWAVQELCWTEEMAEAVVQLRAIYLSGDFDLYWSFHITKDQQRLHPGNGTVVLK